MESTDSSTGSPHPNLPPGFRFHPTDEELVVHYLKKKANSAPLPVAIIAEVDLYKFDPWELPAKATFGEQEWYFFSPRDRKYPNGARPNRAATSGYWKATGTDKPVLSAASNQKVGVKKALVFYGGKPPKGIKTNWIMHEYRMVENKPNYKPPGCDLGNKKNSLRLDDWVLCRIYKKNNTHRPMMDLEREDSMDDMTGPIVPSIAVGQQNLKLYLPKATTTTYGALFETDHQQNMFEGGIVTSDHGVMSQLPSSSCKPEPLPMFPALSAANSLPLKPSLPSALYWNDEEAAAGTSSSKRLHLDDTDVNGSTSFSTLLTQLPHTTSMHQQAMLGSIGDGLFRVPGLSWYS